MFSSFFAHSNQEGNQEGTEAEITNVEGESQEEATDNNGATVESN